MNCKKTAAFWNGAGSKLLLDWLSLDLKSGVWSITQKEPWSFPRGPIYKIFSIRESFFLCVCNLEQITYWDRLKLSSPHWFSIIVSKNVGSDPNNTFFCPGKRWENCPNKRTNLEVKSQPTPPWLFAKTHHWASGGNRKGSTLNCQCCRTLYI